MAIVQNNKAYLALSRFGFGISHKHTEKDLIAISRDSKAAVLAEIEAGITPMSSDLPTKAIAVSQYYEFQKINLEELKKDPLLKNKTPDTSVSNLRNDFFSLSKMGFQADIGFVERWLLFWDNHFTISSDKGALVRSITGSYNRDTVRKYGLGQFSDLLIAVERHPAMLMYLDNSRSTGPNSPVGLRTKTGLNENLAREILELHTLGVNGGYNQKDVTEFAKIITGWTVRSKAEMEKHNIPFDYVFAPQRHEPKSKTVLGVTYEEGEHVGLEALKNLALHPKTAKFLAKKIATHFVADIPPPSLVKKLADNFVKTKGNLKELAKTLVTAEEAWQPELQKIRRPYEWLMATYRATNNLPEPQHSIHHCNIMGQPFWRAPSPKGFSDENATWLSSINNRIEIAQILARAIKGESSPMAFAEKALSGNMTAATRQTISRAESLQQGVILTLLSPEFLRR